ncbi:VVA0879 family protein [Streptomyces sp. NPDC004237]|uniref:VVA0879 family protein n=1 Tax=Streptomyces sp. NPDC004237 TaxID=3154455 RepID=UPI0033B7AB5A
MTYRKLTQSELLAEAAERFGVDPLAWAFQCPTCKDIATGADFRAALEEHPRTHIRTKQPVVASDLLGTECIGRTLGALNTGYTGRGCDWAAFGLLRGPWEVVMSNGQTVPCFPLAPKGGA